MKKNLAYILLPVVIPLAALSTLLILLGCARPNDARSVLAAPLEVITPTVLAVEPVFAPNDLDTPAVILGTGFAAVLSGTQVITPPTAYLGNAALSDVIWVSTTTLSATVPWGLEPGVYTLTVVNPDGGMGSLPNAFTVTQGIGVWTTNGPYGGGIGQIVLHPKRPDTVYAWGEEVGTFVSDDAGEHWEMVLRNPKVFSVFEFDSQNADVFYVGDALNLYRTMDNALTWEVVNGRPGGWPYYAPAAHPTLPGVIISAFGTEASPDPEGGIYRSDDYGSSWYTLTNGLTDTHFTSLAIHPVLTQTMLAGTENGNIFYSLDGGGSWTWTNRLTDTIAQLYFNSFEPLQAWATITSNDVAHNLYRSEDLIHWTSVIVDEAMATNRPPPPRSGGWDMDFLGDTIWATMGGAYFSTDGGDSWTLLSCQGCDAPGLLAINPADLQTMYGAGFVMGVCKSVDGGLTWRQSNNGLASIIPLQMAISPSDPDTLYVRTSGLEVDKSDSGGQVWRALDMRTGGTPQLALAIDPFEPEQVYVGGWRSEDGGESWRSMTMTLPITYSSWLSEVSYIAPHPSQPGNLLAVLTIWSTDYPTATYGLIYHSDDYGDHWAWAEGALLPAWTVRLAYDAFNPSLVYAATWGAGAWKSSDGGNTWQAMLQPGGKNEVHEVFTHPAIANRVYAYYTESDELRSLYVSDDAGETWEALPSFGSEPYFLSPIAPYWLFEACGYNDLNYLCRSGDGGYNWEPIIEVPAGVHLLNGGTDGERLIIYIGSPGGFVSGLPGVQTTAVSNSIPGRDSLLGAGIYRLTIVLPTEWVYLPFVSRDSVP